MEMSILDDSKDDLRLQHDGCILTVTFNRPQSRNALTLPMYDHIEAIVRAASTAGETRVIVFTGAGGKAFASGTDVGELKKITSAEQALAYEKRGARLVEAIESCSVPCIAAIDGVCAGGGLAIAAACDLRIATAGSRFGMPIAKTMGNCLSLASCRLLGSLIGAGRLKRLIFTAELWSAPDAERYGLIDEVVASGRSALDRAHEIAAKVATHAPLTLEATKVAIRLLREGHDPDGEEAFLTKVYSSRDFAEGLTAFVEKRTPVWTGI